MARDDERVPVFFKVWCVFCTLAALAAGVVSLWLIIAIIDWLGRN